MKNNQFKPFYREFCERARLSNLSYMIIGGAAVAFYGVLRDFKDFDVWISKDSQNIKTLLEIIKSPGFRVNGIEEQHFLKNPVIRLGVPPGCIEISSVTAGIFFDECFPRRETALIDGIEVSIISLDDLKRTKLSSGRKVDLDDLEKLKKLSAT